MDEKLKSLVSTIEVDTLAKVAFAQIANEIRNRKKIELKDFDRHDVSTMSRLFKAGSGGSDTFETVFNYFVANDQLSPTEKDRLKTLLDIMVLKAISQSCPLSFEQLVDGIDQVRLAQLAIARTVAKVVTESPNLRPGAERSAELRPAAFDRFLRDGYLAKLEAFTSLAKYLQGQKDLAIEQRRQLEFLIRTIQPQPASPSPVVRVVIPAVIVISLLFLWIILQTPGAPAWIETFQNVDQWTQVSARWEGVRPGEAHLKENNPAAFYGKVESNIIEADMGKYPCLSIKVDTIDPDTSFSVQIQPQDGSEAKDAFHQMTRPGKYVANLAQLLSWRSGREHTFTINLWVSGEGKGVVFSHLELGPGVWTPLTYLGVEDAVSGDRCM